MGEILCPKFFLINLNKIVDIINDLVYNNKCKEQKHRPKGDKIMTKKELQRAYEWGKAVIKEYHDNGEKAPAYLYERLAELLEKYMEV